MPLSLLVWKLHSESNSATVVQAETKAEAAASESKQRDLKSILGESEGHPFHQPDFWILPKISFITDENIGKTLS